MTPHEQETVDQKELLACRSEGTTTALIVAIAALCTTLGVMVGAIVAFACR